MEKQKQLKCLKLEEETKRLVEEARINAAAAIRDGKDTAEMLQRQTLQLHEIEDTVEANHYTLKQSERVLRGMTWSGYFYNAFTNEPVLQKSQKTSSIPKSDFRPVDVPFYDSNNNVNNIKDNLRGGNEIAEISRAVDELKDMGLTIGKSLDENNSLMNNLDKKIDKNQDSTLFVTLKASKLMQNNSKPKRKLGIFQFEYLSGQGYYLAANDQNELIVKENNDKSTYFNLYTNDNQIFFVQNYKTLLFIGLTWLGSVSVSTQSPSSNEEIFINLEAGQMTGMLFLASNWGKGGWVKGCVNKNQKLLSDVTNDISNKTDMAYFLPIQKKN